MLEWYTKRLTKHHQPIYFAVLTARSACRKHRKHCFRAANLASGLSLVSRQFHTESAEWKIDFEKKDWTKGKLFGDKTETNTSLDNDAWPPAANTAAKRKRRCVGFVVTVFNYTLYVIKRGNKKTIQTIHKPYISLFISLIYRALQNV